MKSSILDPFFSGCKKPLASFARKPSLMATSKKTFNAVTLSCVLTIYFVLQPFDVLAGEDKKVVYKEVQNTELLAYIRTTMDDTKNLQGNFAQSKKLKDVPFPLKSSGNFEVNEEKYLRWSVVEPIQSELLIDIAQQRIQLDNQKLGAGNSDPDMAAPEIKLVGEILIAVFSGDWEKIQKYFEVKGQVAEAENSQRWKVYLIPKSDVMLQVIQSIELEGGKHVQWIKLQEAQRDATEIQFLHLKSNVSNPSQDAVETAVP